MLSEIQAILKAPKAKFNSFGKYQYRSVEDILLALKPILSTYQGQVIMSDELIEVGGKNYVKATATIIAYSDGERDVSTAVGWAQEALQQKGMNTPQLTLSASSFARKQAMQGLLAIDDSFEPEVEQGSEPEVKTFSLDDIKKLLTKTKTDVSKFCTAMGVSASEDLDSAGLYKAGVLLTKKLEKMQ